MVVFVSLAFLGSIHAGKEQGNPDVLSIAVSSDPIYLNPVLASDGVSMHLNSFIFNTLIRYNEKLQFEPALAESWEILDGGKKVIFHLRKDVKWHDGKQFTASDCVFTFEKVLDPTTNTFNRGLFRVMGENIKFKAIDDFTLEADLPRPFAPFFNNLTLMGIVPEHILKGENINKTRFNRNPMGTGPFIFREWKTSDQVVLTANANYFRGSPKVKKVIFKIIPSGEGRRIALASNQVDISALSAEDLFVMGNNIPENVRIFRWQDFTYFYFAFDLTNPKFDDLRVRQAINYAVDTDTVIEAALHGAGYSINGPIPRASWAYTDDVKKYPYNPEKASKLLTEAGWKMGQDGIRHKNGENFSFQLIYKSGSHSSETASVFIQSYLKDVGINVRLQPLDFGALINSLYPGKFESVVFDWVEPFDPDIYTEWHSSQMGDVGMNFMSYSNPKVDKLLEEARSTFDRERRKKLYFRIQDLISRDAPYVFLWNQQAIIGVNRRVGGLPPPSPLGLTHRQEKITLDDRDD